MGGPAAGRQVAEDDRQKNFSGIVSESTARLSLIGQETQAMTEFPETRATLLAGVKAAENRDAWESFLATYRPGIYRMARRRGLQDADAQDVVQNILVRVSGAIADYEQQPGTKFRHWLRRVARNAILSTLSRSPRDAATGGSQALEALEHRAEEDTSQELEHEYRREQFHRAAAVVRADVNAETWQAFELTVIQGQTCEAAAATLNRTLGTVYAARSRIIKRLREQLDRMQAAEA